MSNRLVISMRLARVVLLALPLFAFVRAAGAQPAAAPPPAPATELPVKKIPNVGAAADFYFAADSFHVIGNAKREGDASYHVYVANIDGGDIRRLNDVGDDACSFFFPDGKRVIWTSTRDHPELDKGAIPTRVKLWRMRPDAHVALHHPPRRERSVAPHR